MIKANSLPSKDPVKRWLLSGIAVLFIVGFPMHFIYEWTGNPAFAGMFAPVNESIWEHLKLTFWPMVIWWSVGYFIIGKRKEIQAARWFTSCAVAMLVCPLVIVTFFYTYTGALGIESLFLDIFSLLLGLISGQGLALHIYNHGKLMSYSLVIALGTLVLLAIAFAAFTFTPPHIPLFKDSVTGSYGISIQ